MAPDELRAETEGDVMVKYVDEVEPVVSKRIEVESVVSKQDEDKSVISKRRFLDGCSAPTPEPEELCGELVVAAVTFKPFSSYLRKPRM